mmetsp:Transcript_43643/g.98471  ORF Transcript_43643/g.98471 Transcript_43643/m.98471 type:complete len:246 (-) Transcript_43643:328-1065(-)
MTRAFRRIRATKVSWKVVEADSLLAQPRKLSLKLMKLVVMSLRVRLLSGDASAFCFLRFSCSSTAKRMDLCPGWSGLVPESRELVEGPNKDERVWPPSVTQGHIMNSSVALSSQCTPRHLCCSLPLVGCRVVRYSACEARRLPSMSSKCSLIWFSSTSNMATAFWVRVGSAAFEASAGAASFMTFRLSGEEAPDASRKSGCRGNEASAGASSSSEATWPTAWVDDLTDDNVESLADTPVEPDARL